MVLIFPLTLASHANDKEDADVTAIPEMLEKLFSAISTSAAVAVAAESDGVAFQMIN